jgi:hypothetical protein
MNSRDKRPDGLDSSVIQELSSLSIVIPRFSPLVISRNDDIRPERGRFGQSVAAQLSETLQGELTCCTVTVGSDILFSMSFCGGIVWVFYEFRQTKLGVQWLHEERG